MDTVNRTSLYNPGDLVSFRFSWYIILVSYFVSLAGALTTVELLHRRTPAKGWASRLQLGACSTSFGLVAIWCMHFVGNRAIVLGNGEQELQLYYSPSYTTASVILPIVVLFLAFRIAEAKWKARFTMLSSLVIAGTIAGLAVTGMHYVGNYGISNYRLHNPARFVLGAAAVAIVASIIALTLFFIQKELWINSVWLRGLCAAVLAGAVSGMHWLASVGTQYRLIRRYNGSPFENNANLIVAIVLAILACCTCAVIAWLAQCRRRRIADRAQHVVLASVTFDPTGRVLVTTDGLLPSQEVTKEYNQRSFEDEFDTGHEVFHWLFKITHNWAEIADLIPLMRKHVGPVCGTNEDQQDHSWSRPQTNDRIEYSVIFRELFCVAAADLAQQMQESVLNLGILYEEILATGKTRGDSPNLRDHSHASDARVEDVEARPVLPGTWGRGQVLFLVRHVGDADVERLTSIGFRFATVNHVGEIIARSMQVSITDLTAVMKSLRSYPVRQGKLINEALFLTCFAMRAPVRTIRSSGPKWEVLVRRENPSELPCEELSPVPLKPWQMNYLTRLDRGTITQSIQHLIEMRHSAPEEHKQFLHRAQLTIVALLEKVPEPFFHSSSFCARTFRVSCQDGDGTIGQATVMPFCVIPDVHTIALKSESLAFTPLAFFKVRQQVLQNTLNASILAREIHQEFGCFLSNAEHLLSYGTGDDSKVMRPRELRAHLRPLLERLRSQERRKVWEKEDSSHNGSVELSSQRGTNLAATQPFGGIMVSSDIIVDAKEDQDIALDDMGTSAEVQVVAAGEHTFVDELYNETKARWQKH